MRELLRESLHQTAADPLMTDPVRGAHLSWMKAKMKDMTASRYKKFEHMTQAVTNA